MKKLTYEHAIKRRPKGYNVKVWEHLVAEAIMNKSWAINTLKTKVHFTSSIFFQLGPTVISHLHGRSNSILKTFFKELREFFPCLPNQLTY